MIGIVRDHNVVAASPKHLAYLGILKLVMVVTGYYNIGGSVF